MLKQSIVVADDHPIFRLGLTQIINNSSNFTVVAEAENRNELIKAIDTTPCDIVILDMKMAENRDGMAALQLLKQDHPEKKVMIMSQMCSQELVDEAMEMGADGYITKNDIAEMILPFLVSITKGQKVLSPRIQSMFMDTQTWTSEKLTSREYEILRLSAEGLDRKEIAAQLDITISTVNFHRQHIKEKLRARNLTEMIHIAQEKGLVG
jgi:DNA-binding NarL/FixJ family response regulator